jgi:hypothetical protein
LFIFFASKQNTPTTKKEQKIERDINGKNKAKKERKVCPINKCKRRERKTDKTT